MYNVTGVVAVGRETRTLTFCCVDTTEPLSESLPSEPTSSNQSESTGEFSGR